MDQDSVLIGLSGSTLAFRLYGGQSGRVLAENVISDLSEDGVNRLKRRRGTAVDRDAGLVIAGLAGRNVPAEVTAFRLPDLEIAWRETYEEIAAQSPRNLQLVSVLGLSDQWLPMRAEDVDTGEWGVVAIARETRAPTAFLGGFVNSTVRTAMVSGDGRSPDLLVTAGKRDEEAIRVMFHDAETLEVRDSLFLTTPFPEESLFRKLRGLTPAPDGRHVYALTVDSLYRVDVREPEIVNSRRRARSGVFGGMTVMRDPPRLFLTDAGGPEGRPSSGELQVYHGETLADRGLVDLRSELIDTFENRPQMRGSDLNTDEDRLYVSSGTAVGGAGPIQRGAFSVVDPQAKRLLDTHFLGDHGVGGLIAF